MEETVLIRRQATAELAVRQFHCALLPVERSWARKEAERLLQSARNEASRLLEQARSQAEEVWRAALDRGVEQGGEEAARMLAEVLAWRKQEENGLRESVPRLACCLAERLLHQSLRLSPECIRSICRGVLGECPAGMPVVVRLHPQDLALLSQPGPDGGWEGQVSFEPCAELGRGDCLVQGGFGQVDGRLEVRLEVLRKALERMAIDEVRDE